MNRYVWKNIVLAGSEPSSFEKAATVILVLLALILCGWGPMG